MKHFLLTRINLYSTKYPASNKPEAISKRLDLFEKYCLPSIQRQNCKNFTPLLITDVEGFKVLKKRIEKYGEITAWVVDKEYANPNGDMFEDPALINICKDAVKAFTFNEPRTLITTMLDSDDSIHKDFVGRIQDDYNPEKTEFLVHENIYREAEDGIYLTHNKRNMFHTLVESFDDFQTCFVKKHGNIEEFAPIRYIKEIHGLKRYHESNLDSRMKLGNPNVSKNILKDFYA